MKTLSLKTQNTLEGLNVLQNVDIIEIIKLIPPKDSSGHFSSSIKKATSDVPFNVYNDLNVLIETTTNFVNQTTSKNFFKIKGTELNQIIYIESYLMSRYTVRYAKLIKLVLSDIETNFIGCNILDNLGSFRGLTSYDTRELNFDLSKIIGGPNYKFILQMSNLKLVDISKLAKTFKLFLMWGCYVGDIDITEYFVDKTYSTILILNSDFIGDICDLVKIYFRNNKFFTFIFGIENTEITLHNKSLNKLYVLIVVTESGATISKGASITGPFEEEILTYNGSTWEGSWLQ